MDTLCGPLGYSDLDREGLLIEGFEENSTFEEQYNYEYYADLIQNHEVNFQTVLHAEGTANTEMLNHLGLVGSDKAVILSVVREDKIKTLLYELKEKFSTIRNGSGIAYTVPMSSVIGVSVYGFLSNNKQTVKE
jgi:hypothetical protein